ncbi:MAG: hypothetical protein ACF8MJ_12040 [Phycisphaerales bacterium JB050]
MAQHSSTPSRRQPPARRRSWKSRLVRAGGGVALRLVIGVVTVTQTAVLRWIVMGQIEGRLGCGATAGSCHISLGGELLVEDLVLHLPGLEGEAGEYLRADELRAHIEWGSLIGGGNPLTDLVLSGSVIRVSLDKETSVVNLSMLRPRSGSGVSSGYPRVVLEDVTVELGEHSVGSVGASSSSYTRLTSLDLEGQMVQRAGSDRVYEVELAQMLGDVPDPNGARLRGEIDRESGDVSLTLTGLDLAEWSSRTAPTRIREFWRALDVKGAIDDATFTYGPNEGLAVRLTPRDVDLLIPITVADEGEASGSRSEKLQMRDVRGTIVFAQDGFTANLAGEIEELACRVSVQYDSYSMDSSYRAQIETDAFSFDDQGQLQRFAPELMLRVLDRFVDPQADLSGFVRVSRGRGIDGKPGRTMTEGILNFSNGSGKFGEYPYPIENITGRVHFDEHEVRLVDIRGESESGAVLTAAGRIWPPRDGAAVEIDIKLRNLKTDELFRESLPENRRSVYRTIFSDGEYDRLRADGVLMSPEDRVALVNERVEVQGALDAMRGDAQASPVEIERARERLEAIDGRLKLPVFGLGGTGTLDIEIRRERGDTAEYEERIVIDIPNAGLVVDRFPYPAVAERLRLTISDGIAVIEPSALRGLRGGSGEISGRVRYSESDYEPDIYITAAGVPIDGMLVQALPGRARFEERALSADGTPDPGFSVHRFLRRLNLVGAAGCEAHIFASESSNTDYRVDVRFDGVEAYPSSAVGVSDAELKRAEIGRAGSEPALLTDLSGEFTVTDDWLDMPRLEGKVAGGGGDFTGRVKVAYPKRVGELRRVTESIEVELQGESIAVEQRLEHVLDAADASRASVVSGLRERFKPSGRVDARLSLNGDERDLGYAIEATNIERVSFDAFGGRAELVRPSGSIGVVPGRVDLHGVEGVLRFNHALAGQLRVEGAYRLDVLGGADAGETLELTGSVREALFESQLPAAVVGEFSPELGERIVEMRLAGLFDTDFTVRSGEAPSMEAELRPKTLALTRHGVTTLFDRASGSIGVSESGGGIDLDFESTRLGVAIEGRWTRSADQAFGLDATINANAAALGDEVHALLPGVVLELMRATEMSSERPVSIRDGRLRLDPGGAHFEGTAGFEGLGLRVGLLLRDLLGRATISASLRQGEEPEVEVDFVGERAEAAGAQLGQLAARIETGERFRTEESGRAGDPLGTVYVPSVSASISGGRFAASGVIRPLAEGSYDGARWQADAELSGVDFGALLADLATDPARAERAPENRGLLDGNLSVTGRLGDVESQRGRALVRIQPAPGADGTEVLRLPGLIEMVKLSSLQAPVGEPIDFAYAEAFIEGSVVNLHDLSAESKSVSIKGSGTMTLPELALDLTFTTVVLRDVSLLTEIVERVRNELVTARVGGTLYDPKVEVEQLSATRRLIDAIIRGEQTQPEPMPPAASPGQPHP